MPVHLSEFSAVSPRSLEEALEFLNSADAVPLAGGTDLMVELEAGRIPPCTFVNLQSIPELQRKLSFDSRGSLSLGALTTFRETRLHPLVANRFPMLARASREIGAAAVQGSATWTGNIANGSPAADGVPALLVYDAQVELTSLAGIRRVPLCDFYTGYKQNVLKAGELITEIRLEPPGAEWQEYYRKVGTRRFQAISKTLLAARIQLENDLSIQDVRLALASVAPFTVRALKTETVLRGANLSQELITEAIQALEGDIQPIDDLRSSADYRRRVSGNLLREFLSALMKRDRMTP